MRRPNAAYLLLNCRPLSQRELSSIGKATISVFDPLRKDGAPKNARGRDL
jgi:hypothetical protein